MKEQPPEATLVEHSDLHRQHVQRVRRLAAGAHHCDQLQLQSRVALARSLAGQAVAAEVRDGVHHAAEAGEWMSDGNWSGELKCREMEMFRHVLAEEVVLKYARVETVIRPVVELQSVTMTSFSLDSSVCVCVAECEV